jgi:hypothetical protein
MIEASTIAHWTPVRFTMMSPEPVIDWCDLSDVAFTEPFFDQTLARALGDAGNRKLLRTSLADLMAVETVMPGRDPDGFIFHLSRCGSTLVSRLAAMLPDVAVVSEAGPVNAFLQLDPTQMDIPTQRENVRLLLRSFGRSRPRAKKFIVKMSSWNIRNIAMLRRAFPHTPWCFVFRNPVEVVASILIDRPSWFKLHQMPAIAARILGVPAASIAVMNEIEFATAAIGEFMKAAIAADNGEALFVDYKTLPDAIWERALPFFGRNCSDEEIATMMEGASRHAKRPEHSFTSDSQAKRRSLPENVAQSIEGQLGPLFATLESRCAEQNG